MMHVIIKQNQVIKNIEKFLTQERFGSGDSMKYMSGDPRRGLNFFFPVSSCQTTMTPSFPPEKLDSVY